MQKSHQAIYFDVGCLIFVCELDFCVYNQHYVWIDYSIYFLLVGIATLLILSVLLP